MNQDAVPFERRSFLTRCNAGLVSLAAMAGLARAQQKPAASSQRWEPVRHDKDDWLERPAKHRVVVDATEPNGVGNAILWTSNLFRTSRNDYGVENSDMTVVVVMRHFASAFGYNDAMWEKYGTQLAERAKMEDPKTHSAPKKNIYNTHGYNELSSMGSTLDSVAKLGGQFAVCSSSTRANAGLIAKATGQTLDAVFAELGANLIGSARLVPAGVTTVSHAQERGYALVRA
jgi:intracellular sulfur oxidation DsrE/DsrF family protein